MDALAQQTKILKEIRDKQVNLKDFIDAFTEDHRR